VQKRILLLLKFTIFKDFSRLYLSNGRAYVTVVDRPSVCLSVRHECIVVKR